MIRGDDHVNNTPRQINMLMALGATIPQYAHLSMILGDDGQKLSKRHGAVSVMQYDEDGYLPEAVLNYLARLGWSHGDAEIFNMQQFCEWFNLDHITPSAAQFNNEKLNWLNAHYIKESPLNLLAGNVTQRLAKLGVIVQASPRLTDVLVLYRERANNLNLLASSIAYFYALPQANVTDIDKHITPEILPIIKNIQPQLEQLNGDNWNIEKIGYVLDLAIKENGLTFPKVAMPLRVILTGGTQSPSIAGVMALLGKQETLSRIQNYLK